LAWLVPTTFGTITSQKPEEVTRATVVPVFTGVPMAGFVPTTRPEATVFEQTDVVDEETVRPD
jgi:hypothetical protein